MGLGRVKPRQGELWIAGSELEAPGHPFYEGLNRLLAEFGFDRWAEELCAPYYLPAGTPGRPSIPPGVYFRMLFVGYFEGLESERGICWRCADSFSLRAFIKCGPTDPVPDHSTLSRTRDRLPSSVIDEVFQFVLGIVDSCGLLQGKVAGADSTYLRADASMRNIVRKGTGEDYREYTKRLASEEGIESPTAEDARRQDRKRKKKVSNQTWESKTDPDARIARMKDGRTRLAYKAENAIDLETGAILAAEIYEATDADCYTLVSTVIEAGKNVHAVKDEGDSAEEDPEETDDEGEGPGPATSPNDSEYIPALHIEEAVADKGYHQAYVLRDLKEEGIRSYIPERYQPGNRRWTDKGGRATADAFHDNRKRVRRDKGRRLQKKRAELLERSFAHLCETGGLRRVRLRGQEKVAKRYKMQAAAANLGLVMRVLFGAGTPRGLAGLIHGSIAALTLLWTWISAALYGQLDFERQQTAGDSIGVCP